MSNGFSAICVSIHIFSEQKARHNQQTVKSFVSQAITHHSESANGMLRVQEVSAGNRRAKLNERVLLTGRWDLLESQELPQGAGGSSVALVI